MDVVVAVIVVVVKNVEPIVLVVALVLAKKPVL